MKTRILLGLIFLLFGQIAYAEDPIILHIRKQYQSINSVLSSLDEETLELNEYSTEGGGARAYRDSSGNIRLIKVQLLGESGKVYEEFYYEAGALIFAFYERHHYNVPFYVTNELAKEIGSEAFDPQKTIVAEDRYYFDKGQMIRWLNDQNIQVKQSSNKFAISEKEVLGSAMQILSKFNRAKPNHQIKTDG